jgi:hypothetical protein
LVSVLEVTFPDEWRSVSRRPAAAVVRPVTPGSVRPHDDPPAASRRTAGVLRALTELDFDRLACFALPDEGSGEEIQAFCAIGVVHHFTGTQAELLAVAESGRCPGLERDTLTVEFPLGRVVRSSAFRFVDELLADVSAVPFAAEVRFALPLPGRRMGVLHFEALSLRRFEELESLFDTIAGTARVA